MDGIWELPSGKVESGESLDQSVAREVLEETGLTAMPLTLSVSLVTGARIGNGAVLGHCRYARNAVRLPLHGMLPSLVPIKSAQVTAPDRV